MRDDGRVEVAKFDWSRGREGDELGGVRAAEHRGGVAAASVSRSWFVVRGSWLEFGVRVQSSGRSPAARLRGSEGWPVSAWTSLTLEVVEAAFPTDLAAVHADWLVANPEKAGRLEAWRAQTVAAYRQATQNNPACELNEDESTVPTTGYLHALNTIFFFLGMEMGVEMDAVADSLMIRADLWKSAVEHGEINPLGVANGGGTPSYEAPEGERGVLG